jgi:hypothetical protein
MIKLSVPPEVITPYVLFLVMRLAVILSTSASILLTSL